MNIPTVDPRARDLGRRIRSIRVDERGWSQTALSEASGLSQGAISRIEKGVARPSLDSLHRLRDALGVTDSEWTLWLELLKPTASPGAGAA